MANSGFGKISTKCANCSSTSQKDVLCVCSCRPRLSPVVVEMSQTSSTGSSECTVSPEKIKENQTSKDSFSGKDLVTIKDSVSQHKLTSHPLIPSLASPYIMGPCQLTHCLLTY